MRNKDVLQAVADAVSDRQSVDWGIAESLNLSRTQRQLLVQLRRIADANPFGSRVEERAPQSGRLSTLLLGGLIGLAAVKTLVALVASVSTMVLGSGNPPKGPLACLLIFGISAIALLVGSASDVRTRSLGVLFLVIAASFADPLFLTAGPSMAPVAQVLRSMPADAFLAYTFWRFVVFFPSAPLTRSARRIASVTLALTLVAGAALFGANVALVTEPVARVAVRLPLLVQLDRQLPEGYFWLLSFTLTIAGIPYLLWKSRFDAGAERQRVTMFASSLAASFMPMLIVVLVTPFVPPLQQPHTREMTSVFVYASLLAVVPLTVYSVRVHGVLKLSVLISRALQLTAVRFAVWGACLMPLLLLAAYLYLNRDMTIAAIVLNEWAVGVLALPVLGALALSFREPLVRAIDRRLLGDSLDLVEVVGRLERELLRTNGVRDVSDVLVREIDRAIHAEPLTILMFEQKTSALVSTTQMIPPLDIGSALARLLRVAPEGVHVGSDAAGPVGRLLSVPERRWLVENRIQLVLPLLGTDGSLLGAVAVGQKRNRLPLSRDDRVALGIIASRGAMVLENWVLRATRLMPALRQESETGVDWTEEPGSYCNLCLTVWAARTEFCSCGSKTSTAAIPMLVSGKFRVQRLLGSGGMAVVYLAIDLTLDRRVVVKALPRLTAERRSRLRQEARAMAAVSHPNLGMIYGVETWRGAPLLIMEFLENDTLAHLLRQRALSIDEVLELGISMTDALDRVHSAGILHRDIKPSNIGYAADGVPKLFDFGVAHVRPTSSRPEKRLLSAPVSLDVFSHWQSHAADHPMQTTVDRIWGTPLYLSPETLAGADPSPLNDLWSLSLVLFEALTRVHPFAATTVATALSKVRAGVVPDVRTYRPDCPLVLADVFARALSIDVSRRPDSAAELRQWLRRIQAETRRPAIRDAAARDSARSRVSRTLCA